MSKQKNLFTGELLMTDVNAARHYIKKGNHFLRDKNMEGFQKMLKERNCSGVFSICPHCQSCPHEDFGYCGLRHNSAITDKEKYLKYCYPAIVRTWEETLK